MANRPIIFRADGGPLIGMGHFTRTLALAEMLNAHFHCVFVTRQPTAHQIAEIEKVCHDRIDLPEGDSHFEQFLAHLKGDEIVVLDNYYFTTEYQKTIKAKGCKLVCIDDMHDKHYVADVVINHAEGVDPGKYSIEPYTKLLLGYKYALLRENYLKPNKEIHEKKYSALIIMGGADPLNITSRILRQMTAMEFDKPVAVVSSRNRLEAFEQSDQFTVFKNLAANQVAQLMQNSEFGILPASTVAIEACAIRLPFVCGYFIDNQKDIYHGIEANGLAVCVGDYTKISDKKIIAAICKLNQDNGQIDDMLSNQASLLDKNSNLRFLESFREL